MAALANLGFDMEVLAAGIYGGEWEADTEERALDMVREGISRGVAVVGWNLDNYEHGLIYGYDDEQRTLLIHDINARTGGELSYDDFGRRARNGTPINPEMFVLVLKVREGAPHLSSTRYSVGEDMSYRVALHTALAMAIRHIEDASQSDDGRFGANVASVARAVSVSAECEYRRPSVEGRSHPTAARSARDGSGRRLNPARYRDTFDVSQPATQTLARWRKHVRGSGIASA